MTVSLICLVVIQPIVTRVFISPKLYVNDAYYQKFGEKDEGLVLLESYISSLSLDDTYVSRQLYYFDNHGRDSIIYGSAVDTFVIEDTYDAERYAKILKQIETLEKLEEEPIIDYMAYRTEKVKDGNLLLVCTNVNLKKVRFVNMRDYLDGFSEDFVKDAFDEIVFINHTDLDFWRE